MHGYKEKTALESSSAESDISLLAMWRLFRSAGKALFSQAELHGQLAQVEWQEEKNRLSQMLLVLLLGFACLICGMMVISGVLLVMSWTTPYREAVTFSVIGFFLITVVISWFRFRALASRSSQGFSATRKELSANIAMVKEYL